MPAVFGIIFMTVAVEKLGLALDVFQFVDFFDEGYLLEEVFGLHEIEFRFKVLARVSCARPQFKNKNSMWQLYYYFYAI